VLKVGAFKSTNNSPATSMELAGVVE